MIQFASPAWFLLFPLLLGGLFWARSWRHPLRWLCLILLTLLLADLRIRRLAHGLDLWVLMDNSASAAASAAEHRQEMQNLLEHSAGPDDRVIYVDYADLAQVRGDGDEIPPTHQQQTRTNFAIQFALGRMAPDRAARLLVVTDGYSTEPLSDAAERLRRQQVALDYRLLIPPDSARYRIANFDLPPTAQTGEPFLLQAEIAGQPDGPVHLRITRDGTLIANTDATLKGGQALVRFTDRLLQPGSHRYAAIISSERDPHPGNNHAEKWIEIKGGPRLLLVTAYPDDPLLPVLREQGFAVEMVEPAAARVGQLSGARAVILNNVPAYQFHAEFLDALDFFVRSQGGGLLMAGGKYAFGSGGYFSSSVDPLLPVSMELRSDQRKLAVAMSIVMDRSGSMAATVAGNIEKIDLADEGAARSIELLGPSDAVSVFAVDTEPHEIVPLTALGANRKELVDTVRRITSAGGGIYVPTGLRAAWKSLKTTPIGQRHVLLFADANDATEELGDYKTLVQDMVRDGITISVIGLGSESDSGGRFLDEIAALGKGRIFYNDDPNALPGIFAQETVTVARSAFIDKPIQLAPAAGWLALAARPLSWPDAVDGYNLSYLKPEATAAAVTGDADKAPLVAFWQRGSGRVAAVSFPLGGPFSQRVRGWPRYADFVQTLGRWLAGDQLPPGLALRTRMDGTELQLDLYYDQSWETRLSQAPPHLLLLEEGTTQPREIAWQRLDPGHFAAKCTMPPGRWVRGAVQVGNTALPFGPLEASGNLEWNFDRSRLLELESVSHASGGQERYDLTKIWQAPHRSEFYNPRALLLTLLLLTFVFDVLATRLNWPLTFRRSAARPVLPQVRNPTANSG